ncbi:MULTISPECIES: aspartate aminotransferase family protein [Rhizobium/Agrobacterium group]|uniref:Aminotransferase class III-fold pyridoxal phosphate-dependent enzyme n=2 Tax=Agrobacterium TaxID=357 RepID=A0A546XJC2_AGRTU|nr:MULTISPECIES: aminotransferase class III-fold pyridoxal phosphate-dependent enzyme [Rhizobium/Agrobacterium group]MCZ7472425.1 aminotransferase class III-fold pyridoxal phosphate-dependent enzyme [Rhizobium rhizogenes]MCZ7483736.1 aminotransferase class III-fold pyridoxal phosphate-dependent enzyme [Rhizobium rhizogenes]MEB3046216.1 aminotransferase class III-fold pyridoxal phosphate-dependent enzyme [Rhizobium sp. MJ21]TRB00839.1 aminotransferase class III-fold pyridoxal phosphate-dependent
MTMVNAFDPNTLSALDAEDVALIEHRNQVLGPAYRLFYEQPLHLVRGEGVWLYDNKGKAYLDAYNNVTSVGHCHPKVVEAVTRQLGILNTHTRYLHDGVVAYADRLLRSMPDALGHMMFTCTGSEANDLALRIARSYTGRQGVIVTNRAYHGVTEAVSEISPALGEFVHRGPRVRLIPAPDSYRVPPEEQGALLARDLAAAIAEMRRDGIEPAAFVVDTIFSSDGLYVDPPGFLKPAVELIRAEGGLFIADEVQPGFARTGETFWGFQRHDVVPDMVSLGKPMGNGFPVAGLALRPELVEEFGTKARYFNTFGGSPVACAAGMAVLDVIEQEGLQENSRTVGDFLLKSFSEVTAGRDDVAQVRGAGLFLAVECIDGDKANAGLASHVVNHLRQNGALISAIGPGANILKIRPPLVLGRSDAERLVESIKAAFNAY